MTSVPTACLSSEETDIQRGFRLQVKHHPRRPHSFHVVTYGCQMNDRDSETLAGLLREMGLSPESRREEADLVLFNTCCVRDNAERRALGNVFALNEAKKQRPHMIIGICGCMMQQEGMAERVRRELPFVDLAFGGRSLHRLGEYLLAVIDTGERVLYEPAEDDLLLEGLPAERSSPFKAYVNIMVGCDNFCSYCVVPYVRGRERSRAEGDILKEVESLLKLGVREVTLLGQNVNSYGKDNGGIAFPELLSKLEAAGLQRIRFMTSHPKDLSDRLIEEMASNRAVCPHLHLPVQSGSDRVLRLMNRGYTAGEYLDKVERLRKMVPGIGMTSDIIVAFPGETEDDFSQTLALVKTVGYDSAFTFVYSPRTGTRAAGLPGRVAPEVSKDRLGRLIALQEEITRRVLHSLIGERVEVLVEGSSRRRDWQLTGKSGRNISVNFPGDISLTGSIVPVRLTGAGSNTLRGVPVAQLGAG